MELREIAAFLQVAQLKSFSKAARALGYSQAAVTIQIKQLEQELGIHLFDRIGKQTILTHQGMVFYDHAAAVMREISCARAAVTESQELTGALTIGTIESICASIFPDLMEAFHKAHPKVKVSMVLDSPDVLLDRMNHNAIDFVYLLDQKIYDHRWVKVLEEPEDGEEGDTVLSRLRDAVQTGAGEARMLVVSEKYRVVYPKNFDDQADMSQIYSAFLNAATDDESFWEQDKILEETIEEKEYLLYYKYVTPSEREKDQKVRHILLYCPVHDTTAMMDQITRVVLLTMSVIAAAAIALFWLVAGSISVPVQRLCEAARGIGEKKFKRVETGATVKELCELEGEINHMQEKLAQADQAERTFFQNASHELRTPLMSISGYAQGIQCGVFEDVAQAASVILDESTRLTEVVDGILTLTRMDQLRYQVVPVELAVNGFIEERLECLEGFAYSKNIKLVFQPGEEHKIITDAMLLERAFSNVMSNCIRYAGTQVAVAVREKEGDILITVTDDGPGFPEGGTEHLFDRFYKGKGGNHGLGLAIARCSLEYMGGSVRAADTQKGAEFEITLPQDCRSFAPDERTEM